MAHLHGGHVHRQPPHPAVCHPAAPAGHPSLTPAVLISHFVFMTHFQYCSRRSHAICFAAEEVMLYVCNQFRALFVHAFIHVRSHQLKPRPPCAVSNAQGSFLGAIQLQMHGCPCSSTAMGHLNLQQSYLKLQPLTYYMRIRLAHCTSNSTKPDSPCLRKPAACCFVCTAAFIIAAYDSCSISTCTASGLPFCATLHCLPLHVPRIHCLQVCHGLHANSKLPNTIYSILQSWQQHPCTHPTEGISATRLSLTLPPDKLGCCTG